MYELGACYGSSLLITIITAIVEASAPLCSEIAPHFGEQHCFFHGKNFFEKNQMLYLGQNHLQITFDISQSNCSNLGN